MISVRVSVRFVDASQRAALRRFGCTPSIAYDDVYRRPLVDRAWLGSKTSRTGWPAQVNMIVLDEMSELQELGEILEAAPCALRTGALLFLGPDQISATRKRCTRSASEVGTLWRTRMAR